MEILAVIILAALMVAAVVYAVIRALPKRKRAAGHIANTSALGIEHAYQMIPSLLTATERNFFAYLAHAVAGELHIFSKVRLADLVEVRSDAKGKLGHLRRITQKHVDFVLCTPDTMRPLLVIELDDSSHERPEAQERDRVKNAALQSAGLPILRVPAQQSYDATLLAQMIRMELNSDETMMLNEAAIPAPASRPGSMLRRLGALTRRRSATKKAKSVSPMKRRTIRTQVAVPVAVILVVVVVFAQLKATSTNANGVEAAAIDPLLTPQSAQPVDTPTQLILPTESSAVNTGDTTPVFAGDATVNVKTLNMRTGPGTQYEVVAAFASGTRLSLLGKDSSGAWVNVKAAEGQAGWMSAKYVTLSVPIENVPVVPGN